MKLAKTLLSVCLVIAASAACKKKEETAAKPADTAAKPADSAAKPADDTAAKPADPAAAKPADTAAAPAGDLSVDALCDKTISMLTGMADAVTASNGDCDALGTALEKWAADNKAFIEQGKALEKDTAKKAEFETTCNPKIMPVMEKLAPAMAGASKCADNAKVTAALSALE